MTEYVLPQAIAQLQIDISAGCVTGWQRPRQLVERLGSRASLAISGVGLLLATLSLLIPDGVPLAIGAFVLLGLAVAGVVPKVLTTAPQLAPGNSSAIAGAMLAGVYLSFMVAPPLIGWLAELFSLQAALVTLGVSGLGMLYLARGIETS